MRFAALFGMLFLLSACGGAGFGVQPPDDVATAEVPLTDTTVPSEEALADEAPILIAADADVALETPPEEAPVLAAAAPAPRRGLLGLLRRAIPAPAEASETGSTPPVVLAALDEEVDTDKPASGGFGLFGSADTPRTGPDARDVTYGTLLPFGEVARVCDARRKPLGRKIESATVRRFKLYDSDPGSLGPRTFYITGFKDDCPRQLTAINVLFGAASFYDLLHYGPGAGHMAYGATDRAYEKVKGRVCGVRKGQPCGSRIGQLEKSTFFVNSYLHHAGSGQWAEMLIHDGDILAASLKDTN